ncbi:SMI1/KNR4 family protein [Cesiribacter sp. SM1]|uniref:SMI1/KNR4 family protein n=1 Tax=Cesiribacter sp. SM1 TaxID=2861196 RepID=UPI001CD4B883|nr:SMI1/KNR4 family protein [Cesiribacter sp. SM1]
MEARFILLILLITIACHGQRKNENALNMDTDWKTYKSNIESTLPIYFERLKEGADLEKIHQLESNLSIKLPEDFFEIYLENNGEDSEWFVGGVMCGMRMLSLEEIEKEWKSLKAIEDEFSFNSNWTGDIVPKGAIKRKSFDYKWIPIFSDNNGNYIGIDLSPDLEGQKGQIINFGTDEHAHCVFANSLNDFLGLINKQFENGVVQKGIFQNEEGQNLLFGLSVESHLIDDLKRMKK